jgi:hypothetical protein
LPAANLLARAAPWRSPCAWPSRPTARELIAIAGQRGLLPSGGTIGELRQAHAAGERACAGWLSAALAVPREVGAGRTE